MSARNNLQLFRKIVIFGSAVFLAIYLPLEVLYSLNHLLNPGFICDVIAFALLGFGCFVACYHRTHSMAPLAAAWGYCSALFWRCYFMRVTARNMDWPIYKDEHSFVEPVVLAALVIAFAALASCIYLSLNLSRSDGNEL